MARSTRLLILGLGNVICSDDGLGVTAVRLLDDQFATPEGVRILDGGTLGLALLPYLTDADDAILVDAVRDDRPAGSLVRLEGGDVAPAVEARLSPHQIGVADLLSGADWLQQAPDRVVLLGLVPATIELGVGHTPAVCAGLPLLVASVVEEARRLGYDLAPRAADASPGGGLDARPDQLLARRTT